MILAALKLEWEVWRERWIRVEAHKFSKRGVFWKFW
jgi:hypothetical protein